MLRANVNIPPPPQVGYQLNILSVYLSTRAITSTSNELMTCLPYLILWLTISIEDVSSYCYFTYVCSSQPPQCNHPRSPALLDRCFYSIGPDRDLHSALGYSLHLHCGHFDPSGFGVRLKRLLMAEEKIGE